MNRFGGALVLGAGVTVGALAFGSRPLGVAGVGLLLAAFSARTWAWLAAGPVTVEYAAEPSRLIEGDRARIAFTTRRRSRAPVGSVTVSGRLGKLGEFECRLSGHGRTATGHLELGRMPRGRYALENGCVTLGDFLGLDAVSARISAGGPSIVAYPRLVELDGLFSDNGVLGGDGRRLLLRRQAGFDFHSVREYEQGESLRRVHWPTTARRGQLMVKELEDTQRDAVVVLLDCDPAGAVGKPPSSSFDAAVRAAGSVLLVHARRGRSATLATTGQEQGVARVRSGEGDLRTALGVLAATEADALHKFPQALANERGPAASAGELVVVTAALEPTAVSTLLDFAGRRRLSVVWVDGPSFAGRPTRAHPGTLRLSAAGVPVSVVRRDDDLASALTRPRAAEAVHG